MWATSSPARSRRCRRWSPRVRGSRRRWPMSPRPPECGRTRSTTQHSRSGDGLVCQSDRVSLPPLPEPLPHPVVDSHCHLDTAQEVSGLDPAEAIDRATAVGVTKIVQVGCDLDGARFAVRAAEHWDSVVAGVAIHPNDAARMHPDELSQALAEIEQLAGHPRVRAVGETGLDHYRTRDEAGHRIQRETFARHIGLARATGKTLVIHDRDAHADVLDVLDAEGVPDRVVMHCFSGDANFARACLDRGAWLSFAGPVTFKP